MRSALISRRPEEPLGVVNWMLGMAGGLFSKERAARQGAIWGGDQSTVILAVMDRWSLVPVSFSRSKMKGRSRKSATGGFDLRHAARE
jgi:hypothetical protein